MKKALIVICSILFVTCASAAPADRLSAPVWVNSLESAYPNRDWIAVTAEGASQTEAEAAAMSALARTFRTDINSLTLSAMQFSQIVNNTTGNITFDESRNFSQEIAVSANIKGLIGVQIDVYRAADSTVHVCARMNRRECAARYSAMIRENTAIINRLLTSAAAISDKASFEVYSRLSFAHAIAQVTDSFQAILEVLDPTAANRKPNYGGANFIKTNMIETASLITIGLTVNTGQQSDRILLTRAAGSFFRDLGFKINEQSAGTYTLQLNARFDIISQNVISCRFFLDAALVNKNGTAVFSFTEDDRKAHPNSASEARRLAVRAAEESFKEGLFAIEFNTWLNSFAN